MYKKNFFFVYDIKLQSQSLEEVELKPKNKGIKGYETMSIYKLLSTL